MGNTSVGGAATGHWDLLLQQYLPDEQTGQLLFVKYTGGSSAEAQLYEKQNGFWMMTVNCAAQVGKCGIGKAKEGDMTTPAGVYSLTGAFGIADDPGAKLPYVKIHKYLYLCADKEYYNRLIDIRECPHTCSGEHMIGYTQCYEYGMFLDFNRENVYGNGSAIFLHVMGNKGYTEGCVAVGRSEMIEFLKRIGPGGKICIGCR